MLLDLSSVISHSVQTFQRGELLKSLKCQVFETVQSDGMEMDTDHVDFFFLFFIFTSQGVFASGVFCLQALINSGSNT